MPAPDGCGMMCFDTPIPAHSIEGHSRCIGRPPGLSPALADCYKGDTMLTPSVTPVLWLIPKWKNEEVVDVLPPVAFC